MVSALSMSISLVVLAGARPYRVTIRGTIPSERDLFIVMILQATSIWQRSQGYK